MKFLFITTLDYGGAASATIRLHHALIEEGHESLVLVSEKTKENYNVIPLSAIVPVPALKSIFSPIRNRVEKFLPKKIITKKEYCFYNLDESENDIDFTNYLHKFPFVPDVIVPSWTSYFINFRSIASLQNLTNARVYWWGLDMSSLTGGCHYSWGCTGYTKDCSFCPAIIENQYKVYPLQNLLLKKDQVLKGNMKFIAGSDSLHEQASKSFLFSSQDVISKVLVCIDEDKMNSKERGKAKMEFGLQPSQRIIFFGSTFTNDKRKGIKYFIEALQKLNELVTSKLARVMPGDITVLIVGNESPSIELTKEIPFQIKTHPFITNDADLARAYKASDVFVCSSIEDSGPMMINESVLCGTPVVSFNIGVSNDLVIDGISGYKATLFNTDEMANGIFNIINRSSEEYQQIVYTTSALGLEKTSKQAIVKQFLQAVKN